MTGGVGREALTAFYRDHFIFSLVIFFCSGYSNFRLMSISRNPADARLEVVSRTVGPDRVVGKSIVFFREINYGIDDPFQNLDEFVYHVTHDRTVDWLLPGIPATGRALSIPMMAVVNIRGDRLYNGEHQNEQITHIYPGTEQNSQNIFGGIKPQLCGKPVFCRHIFRILTLKPGSHRLCVCPLSEWKAHTCLLTNRKAKVMRCYSRDGRRHEMIFNWFIVGL